MSASELTKELPVQNRQVKPSKRVTQKTVPIQYRVQVFIRFSIALVGGYIVSALLAMVVSLLFRHTPVDAIMSATLLAFICHVGIFIWVFMQHSLVKAILGVIIPLFMLAAAYFVLGGNL